MACHQFHLVEEMDVLSVAAEGATFLLESPYGRDEVWSRLPLEVREQVVEKRLRFFVIDAHRIAREAGLKGRINTVMQTCFFALSNVLPRERAIDAIRGAVRKSYAKGGDAIVARNVAAIDAAMAALEEVQVPAAAGDGRRRRRRVPEDAPDFVKRVTSMILEGRGDLLPVSAMPIDGTFTTGTARYEKRSIAEKIPIWDPDICIQCGLCPLVCPHAAIRMKAYPEGAKTIELPSLEWKGKEAGTGLAMSIQVAPDDCTGCGVCVEVCPAKSKEAVRHKAINMEDKTVHLDRERERFDAFLALPSMSRAAVRLDTVKGSQLVDPLFEYSGACAGCGETPYLKLLTQLFGDRLVVANATGCSSIYGGNLPTTPWAKDQDGRGPAWANSLFEDNAEFGLGMRLAVDHLAGEARMLIERIDSDLAREILAAPTGTDESIVAQRGRIEALTGTLGGDPDSVRLRQIAHHLVPRTVWIVGGDGWAYDIGFGGLDHILASGRNVNILVLDTEVYSNTGGQASKATPRGAIAKFAAQGKSIGKKDLGMIAMAYQNVYVAQVALGASPNQTIKALTDAESYPGVSLIIAYSTCIAHGIDMTESMSHQKEAAKSGYWPLYHFDPRVPEFHLDGKKPSVPFKSFAMKEARFAMLALKDRERSNHLLELAQKDIDDRWRHYEQLASLEQRAVEDER